MKEKRVTRFRKYIIAPACKALVCMTAIVFLATAFALQGTAESSVEGVAGIP